MKVTRFRIAVEIELDDGKVFTASEEPPPEQAMNPWHAAVSFGSVIAKARNEMQAYVDAKVPA